MPIYFYGCITMDGYLADSHHRLDWLYESGDVAETDYQDFYNRMTVTLMGRRTFDEIKDHPDIDQFYPTTDNYVFTHQKTIDTKGFTAVSGDVVSFVQQFEADQHIWVVGGNTILAPLLEADLVDSLIIQIAPVLLGNGIPLFTQKEGLKRFKLEKINQYGQFAEMVYHK